MRVTRPRATVLHWLDTHRGHHTADQIVEWTALPRATVYHVLAQLSAAGLLLVTPSATGGARYETAADAHHHFTCRKCDSIVDIACAADTSPCMYATVPGAVVEHADVTFRGICRDCA